MREANITIIEGTGASQLGIGMVCARIAETVGRDEHAVLPIGSFSADYGVTLSLPSVLGRSRHAARAEAGDDRAGAGRSASEAPSKSARRWRRPLSEAPRLAGAGGGSAARAPHPARRHLPGPYDGTYVGSTRLVGFSSPDWHCYWDAPPITVVGGRFSADIDGAPMTVRIARDGSFDHYAARPVYAQTKYETPVHIFGRIAGGVMDATVHQPRCMFKLDLARR